MKYVQLKNTNAVTINALNAATCILCA